MNSLASLPLKPSQWCIPLVITIAALCCYFFEENLFQTVGYYHSKITNGEVWRLLSGHFFHSNKNHVIMNLLGLWCLWLLHGDYYRYVNMILVYLVTAISAALGMYFVNPDIEIYVGLSGVLHGVLIWGALKDIQHKYNMGYLLLFATIGKIGFEQHFGASGDVVELIEMNVAINAHLFGAIGGGIAFFIEFFYTKLNKKAT